MSTALDYSGRAVDVIAFRPPAGGDGLLTQSLVDPSQICAGVQKVAQRWAIAFLTPRGTVPYRPDYGGEFTNRLARGAVRTEADAVRYFHESALLVGRQVRTAETDADPADERFDRADLVGLAVNGDRLEIRVRIRTTAGDGREILLPIPTVP